MGTELYRGQAEAEDYVALRIAKAFAGRAWEYVSPTEAMASAFASVMGKDYDGNREMDHRIVGMAWFRIFRAWGKMGGAK